MPGISRRTILKGGLAGLSSIVLGQGSFPDWVCAEADELRTYVSLYTGRVTHGIPTTCGLCPAGCGMLAFVDEGSLVDWPEILNILTTGVPCALMVRPPCKGLLVLVE